MADLKYVKIRGVPLIDSSGNVDGVDISQFKSDFDSHHKLSTLVIDSDKDWQGRNITNVGLISREGDTIQFNNSVGHIGFKSATTQTEIFTHSSSFVLRDDTYIGGTLLAPVSGRAGITTIGNSSRRFKDLYLSGNIDINGLVDGVDISEHTHDGTAINGPKISASNLIQDASNRLVTDAEKSSWNAKWVYNENTIKSVKVDNAVVADRSDILSFKDTRNVNDTPGDKQKRGLTCDFKLRSNVGNPPVSSNGNYVFIITAAGYGTSGDSSGGTPVQLALGKDKLALRYGTSLTEWSNWSELAKTSDIDTHASDNVVHITSSERATWNAKWNYDENTIKSVKVDKAKDADTVSGFTVAKSVPSDAKFTDTTYSEITTAEIDAGTASTLRTISGRRAKYILDKAQSFVDTHEAKTSNPHGVTKAQVGLGNVDNIKQATKAEFNAHDTDDIRHITASERTAWNAKQNALSGNVTGHYHSSDRNRSNHTGTQPASTITGLATVATSGEIGDIIINTNKNWNGKSISNLQSIDIMNKFSIEYNSTENSLDFIYI
jgi:hypothetical protein